MSNFLKSTGLRWLWLAVAVLIIDLSSKLLVINYIALGDTVPLFSSFNLHYVRNYGAAFGFFADKSGWQRWFFVGIAIITCLALFVFMYNSNSSKETNNIAYAMVIGGALGNLIDRLWHGFVVDMIDFYFKNWHFATFNFADSIICIGVILIILEAFS